MIREVFGVMLWILRFENGYIAGFGGAVQFKAETGDSSFLAFFVLLLVGLLTTFAQDTKYVPRGPTANHRAHRLMDCGHLFRAHLVQVP
jgi:hypothetical protein